MSVTGAPVTINAARTPAGIRFTCDSCGPDWVRFAHSPETIARALAEAFAASAAARFARAAMAPPRHRSGYTDTQQHNPADWTYLHAGDAKIRHPTTHDPVDCPEGSWLSPGGTVHSPTSKKIPAAAKRAHEQAVSGAATTRRGVSHPATP